MPDPTRRAAAVALFRRSGEALEVFLAVRSPKLKAFGGYWAFPGGAVEAGDGDLPSRLGPEAGSDRATAACALREVFEETGLAPLASTSSFASGPSAEDLRELRAALVDERGASPTLKDFLQARALALDGTKLRRIARFITPGFSATRFDTTYFLLEASGEPEIIAGELITGAWHRPADLLGKWRRGGVRVPPPVLAVLDALASAPLDDALRALGSLPERFEGSGRAIPFAPGYALLPLVTPPLPPEIPTNTILVGATRFLVVDPGPREAGPREHLIAAIEARIGAGDRLEAVFLTHHHPDHVGALDAVVERFRAPVWAHPLAGSLLGRSIDRPIGDGDEIDLGESLDGRAGWRLRAVFTPGHAEDHMALHDDRFGCLIAGDLLSTLVSMYVGSPGGNIARYIASLERIRGLEIETLYPAHGVPSHRARELIDETIEHRRGRIEEVYARLGPEPSETEALARKVYAGAAEPLRPLFLRATRAALEYLVDGGRAEKAGVDSFRRK